MKRIKVPAKKAAKAEQVVAPAIIPGLPESGRITVACKLPHGLVLRVFVMDKVNEPINNGVGYREVSRARQMPGEFTLHGNAVAIGESPKCQIVGGYALTPNVPAELYNKWLEQNKDSDVVRNNLILAFKSIDMAEGASEERSELRSGLEPMAFKGRDPRAPKGISKDDGGNGDRKAA